MDILGCFHVLAIVNRATVKMGVHVSFSIMVFSEYVPRRGISGYMVVLGGSDSKESACDVYESFEFLSSKYAFSRAFCVI